MMAMQAIISKIKLRTVDIEEWEQEEMVALGAYGYASAMLAEKMKREEKT